MDYLQAFNKWEQKPTEDKFLKKSLKKIKKKKLEEIFNGSIKYTMEGINEELGAGPKKINQWTIAAAAKAFGDLLVKESSLNKEKGIIICRDNRKNSRLYFETATKVLSIMGFKVYTFWNSNIQPDFILSYAIKKLKVSAGIKITTSSEFYKFNGFQAYNEHGFKLNKNKSKELSNLIASIDMLKVPVAGKMHSTKINNSIIYDYITDILHLRIRPNDQKLLKVSITTSNGITSNLAPKILQKMDFSYKTYQSKLKIFKNNKNLVLTKKQMIKKAIFLGYCRRSDISIVINSVGTKMVVAVKDELGKFTIVTQSQIASLILKYRIEFSDFDKKIIYTNKSSCLISHLIQHKKIEHMMIYQDQNIKTEGLKYLKAKTLGVTESNNLISSLNTINEIDVLQELVQVVELSNYLKTQNKTLINEINVLWKMFGEHTEYEKIFNNLSINIQNKLFIKILKKNKYAFFGKSKNIKISNQFIKIAFKNGTWFYIQKYKNLIKLHIEITTFIIPHKKLFKKQIYKDIRNMIYKT